MLILLAEGDDTVAGAAIVSTCILLHQVTDVDDEAILDHGHRDPIFGGWIPHLQTLGARLLQQDRDGTEVSVGSD